jgi:AraC-like DNA-binding protein
MAQNEHRNLSLLELKAILQEASEEEIKVHISRQVGAVKQLVPALIRHLAGTPFVAREMRVMLVKRGSAHPIINLLPLHVEAGDLVFVGKNSTIFNQQISDDTEAEGFTMGDELFHLAMGGVIPPSLNGHLHHFVLHLDAAEMAYVQRLIGLLYDTISDSDYSTKVLMGLASAFWWNIDALYSRHQQELPQEQGREQRLFSRFIALVNEHARREHNLDFYANQLCLSTRYMGTLIKQLSGHSAKYWIDEALITSIKVELIHSNKSLKEISDELNFPNTSFFSKFFKRMTGMTAGEYRQGEGKSEE